MNRLVSRSWVTFLAFALSTVALQAPAQAAMVTTDQLTGASQHQSLSQQLLRDDVRQELLTLGVDPAKVQERINNLSTAELAELQSRVDQLPAGGALGTIALVLLILILLDVAGVTDIFPGV